VVYVTTINLNGVIISHEYVIITEIYNGTLGDHLCQYGYSFHSDIADCLTRLYQIHHESFKFYIMELYLTR
jgi:hypothetical protein